MSKQKRIFFLLSILDWSIWRTLWSKQDLRYWTPDFNYSLLSNKAIIWSRKVNIVNKNLCNERQEQLGHGKVSRKTGLRNVYFMTRGRMRLCQNLGLLSTRHDTWKNINATIFVTHKFHWKGHSSSSRIPRISVWESNWEIILCKLNSIGI